MRLPTFLRRSIAIAPRSTEIAIAPADPVGQRVDTSAQLRSLDQAADRAEASGAAAIDVDAAHPIEPATPPNDTSHQEPGPEAQLRQAHQAQGAGRLAEARSILEAAAQQFPDFAPVRHDLARMAEADGDWAAAERWWRDFAALTPDTPGVVTHIAHFIRLQGRLSDAETWVADSLGRFPQHPALFIDHATMAEMRRDWPIAAARWTAVAERFPDAWEGPTGQARMLREQGHPMQARALLQDLPERFPTAVGPLHELARVAEILRDWPAAERWWRESLALDPRPWWAHFGLVTALREQRRLPEAEAVLTSQCEQAPHEPWPFIEYARLAERLRDWAQALRRWDDVVDRFPDRWEGYGGRARALRDRGDVAAARDVLTGAAQRFPGLSAPLHDMAWLEEIQRDWPAAEQGWRRYIALEPGHWRGYIGLATALREQQRLPEADATLAAQLERFGHDPVIPLEHARLAEWAADWPEAANRWSAIQARFPHLPDAPVGHARALREQGRTDEARDLLAKAAVAFPESNAIHLERARLAEKQRDWSAAERSWRAFVQREPGSWWAYTGLAACLREQGRTAEAEEVLAAQFTHLAAEPPIFIEHALLAERVQDWPRAAQRWQAVTTRFPHILDARLGLARAMSAQRDFAAAARILREAAELHPTDPALLMDRAKLATAIGDHAEAFRQWMDVCNRFPDLPAAREELAAAAMWIKDFTLAEQLCAQLRAADPSQVPGWFIAVSSMRARGADADADALLAEAPAEIFHHHDVMSIWVTLPRPAGDWGEQLRRALLMFEIYPDSAKSHMHIIYAYCYAGKQAEADQAVLTARSRWPDDMGLMQAESFVAMQNREWTRALPLLERLLAWAPGDVNYRSAYDSVRLQLAA